MRLSTLLQEFHEIAENPKKQMDKYLSEGKKIILVAPVYNPEEIVHSMGAVPFGAWGGDVQIKKAKEYFPPFISNIAQSIVELGMDHVYDGVSALMVPQLSDNLKVLGQNFRFAVPSIPFIPVNYPQNRKPDFGFKFTLAIYNRVIEDITKFTSLEYDPEKLKASIEIYNEHNGLMRELAQLLQTCSQITAGQRSDIFKSAFFMLKEEHMVMVKELIDLLSKEKPEHSKIPIMITGLLACNAGFNKIIDDCGMYIAADDLANESRQYHVDTVMTGEPLEDLARKFQAMGNCSFLYDPKKERVQTIVDTIIKSGSKGIIFAMSKFCDTEEFDYPLIKQNCDAHGIPSVMVELDREIMEFGQIQTSLEAFSEVIG